MTVRGSRLKVTDLSQARAKREDSLVTLKREPLTVICQVSNVRAEDGERLTLEGH